MTDHLEPCRYCNGEADIVFDELGGSNLSRGMCLTCFAVGPEKETEAEAIAAWNRGNQAEAALREEVERLNFDCDQIAARATKAQDEAKALKAENKRLREVLVRMNDRITGIATGTDSIRLTIYRDTMSGRTLMEDLDFIQEALK